MRHLPKHLETLRELAYERPPDWRPQTRRLLRALYLKEAHFGTAWDYARGHALLEGVEAAQVEREREAALGDGLWREPTLGLEMIWVPPGAFGRGWNPIAPDRLEGFSLARDPVTITDFLHFAHTTGYAPDARQLHPERYLGYADLGPELPPQDRAAWLKEHAPELSRHPIAWVSWLDALAWCSWARLTLPTERQWEKAARGADGRRYPWGDDLPTPKLAHISHNRGLLSGSAPVASFPHTRTAYGCRDMVGNVAQWCLPEDRQGVLVGGGEPPALNEADWESRRVPSKGTGWSARYADEDGRAGCEHVQLRRPFDRASSLGFRPALG